MKYLAFSKFTLEGNFGDTVERMVPQEFEAEDDTSAFEIAMALIGWQVPNGNSIQVFRQVGEILAGNFQYAILK